MGFCLPANIDGATTLSFQTQNPLTKEFKNLYDDVGQEVTVAVVAGQHVSADAVSLGLAPWTVFKVRLGTSTTPVTATADRVITIVIKE